MRSSSVSRTWCAHYRQPGFESCVESCVEHWTRSFILRFASSLNCISEFAVMFCSCCMFASEVFTCKISNRIFLEVQTKYLTVIYQPPHCLERNDSGVEFPTLDYGNPGLILCCGVKTLGKFFHSTLLQLYQ